MALDGEIRFESIAIEIMVQNNQVSDCDWAVRILTFGINFNQSFFHWVALASLLSPSLSDPPQ